MIVNKIKEVAAIISQGELERLRIEEELLYILIKNSSASINVKKEAFERIQIINSLQLKAMGQCLKG